MHNISKKEIHDFHTRFNVINVVRGKRSAVANLWIFHSSKNDKRFAIRSDRDFARFVFLEGNVSIDRYDPYPAEQLASGKDQNFSFSASAKVFLRSGDHEWWIFNEGKNHKEDQGKFTGNECHVDGRKIVVAEPLDFRAREIEFDNWLVLCAAINRNRNYSKHLESAHLLETSRRCESIELGQLLNEDGTDPALMFAAVAKLLQGGKIFAELRKKLICTNTKLYWGPQ